VCDRCAFSDSHKHHLGCEKPFACSRCTTPRNPSELMVYAKLGLRLLACCAICSPWRWRREREMPPVASLDDVDSLLSGASTEYKQM
jgi:hypothetical protein